MWYESYCPFEGPTDEGRRVNLLVELKEDEDFEDLWRRVRDCDDRIDEFYEHSVREELTREIGELSEEQIKERVGDMFEPDYAIFADGRIYHMEYINDCRWIESEE